MVSSGTSSIAPRHRNEGRKGDQNRGRHCPSIGARLRYECLPSTTDNCALSITYETSSLLTKVEDRVAIDPTVVVRLSTARVVAVVLCTAPCTDILWTAVSIECL